MVRNAVRLVAAGLAVAAMLDIAACNYTEGECYPREDIEGTGSDGAGGGPILPGWGGYGDAPPEPQDATEPPPLNCNKTEQPDPQADPQHRCAVPASDACVQHCASIGAYCVHRADHPRSPSSGVGDLYWCKGGWPTYTCSYKYANGDNCHWIYPLGTQLCLYQGGKK